MSTLADYREAYYTHSGKASDVARQLAFAGIAVIWVLRVQDESTIPLPAALLLPLLLLALSLAADLLQYVSATISWGSFHRYHEKREGHETAEQIRAPRWLNWPGLAFFTIKLLLVSAAYLALGKYLWSLWAARPGA